MCNNIKIHQNSFELVIYLYTRSVILYILKYNIIYSNYLFFSVLYNILYTIECIAWVILLYLKLMGSKI